MTRRIYEGLQRVIDHLEDCKDCYEHNSRVSIPKDEVNKIIDWLEELKDED